MTTADHYSVLGVSPSADEVVIRAAYRALAQRYHPDKWQGDPTVATQKMAEINAAYAVLSDREKKREYDQRQRAPAKSEPYQGDDDRDQEPEHDQLRDDWTPYKKQSDKTEFLWVIFGIMIFGNVAALFKSNWLDKTTEISSTSTAASAASPVSTSPSKLQDLCYVYWDGIRWKEGKTKADDFLRYRRTNYGIELVELSIPRAMTNSLGLTRSGSGEEENSQKLKEFLDKYWYQIDALCDFS